MVILQEKIAGLSEATLDRFVLRARRAARLPGMVNVLVTSSAVVRSLNHQYRGHDNATDVLSFPSSRNSAGSGRATLAGEVAISADIAARNARRFGHSWAQEIRILTLHGILHLAGFDHERDNGQMARKEMQLRRALGLPVALIERVQPALFLSAKRQSSKPRRHPARSASARRPA